MATISTLPGFHDNDLILKPYNKIPTIEDNVGQTIAYLMARNSVGQLFHTVQCDAQGRLIVTTGGVGTQIVNQFNVTATNTEIVLVQPNPNRTQITIQNNGNASACLGLNPGLPAASLIQIYTGGSITFDNWTGPIYLSTIAVSGTTVCAVMEF